MENATLATRLTPSVPAGIATLAISGPDALRCLAAHVELRVAQPKLNRIHYGQWTIRGTDGHELGCEQVVVCLVAADTVEVHCHGGPAVCSALLQQLEASGCQVVDPQDWPSWASGLPGRIEQAAENDLKLAATDRVAAALLDQLQGALRRSLERIRAQVIAQDTAAAIESLASLQAWGRLGQKLTQGWRVVLAGPPNVGKSSLLNRLVGRTQAIVHPEAGTTRDWIESPAVFDGWPVLLTDTAGLRASQDAIESEGVRRAYAQIATADLLVLTVDATQGMQPMHHAAIAAFQGPIVLAWNKVDLLSEARVPAVSELGRTDARLADRVAVSASHAPGVDALAHAVVRRLVPHAPPAGQALPFRIEHAFQIRAMLAGLRKGDLADVQWRLDSLLESD